MTAQQVLAAHVTEAPRAVTELRETVPEALGEVLMRCLEKKPADRWQSAEELLQRLEAFATSTAGITPTQMTPTTAATAVTSGTPLWMKVAVPVALAAIAFAVWLGQREPVDAGAGEAATVAEGEEVTERLVVLPLENLTDDPELDVLGRLAADQVARSIDQPQPVPVVPSTTVRDAYRQLGDDATTAEVATVVAATHALAGTIASAAGQLRMEVELIDVRSGERLRTFDPVAGPVDSTEALIARLAAQATAGAVAHLDPESPQWMATGSLPVSLEAYQQHLQQLDLFCALDYPASVEAGRRAVALSPEYIPALGQMGVALSNLRREAEADSVFEILRGLRDRMTTTERALYDWMMGNRTGDPALATRGAEEGFRADPAGFGGNATLTAYRTNRMNDAVERYFAAARPGGCIWTGTWSQGSVAFHALGRYEEELEVAREGLQYWPDRRSFMDIEIRAFAGMGRLDAADSVLAVMASLPPQAGSDPALRPVWAARELRAHGHEAEADAMFAEALDAFASRTTSSTSYNLGRALFYALSWADAAPIFDELVRQQPENLDYLYYHGVTLAKLGDREGALEVARHAAELDRVNVRGRHLLTEARIVAALGDVEDAIRLLQQAFASGGFHGTWSHRDPALDPLRGNAQFESLMRPR
jgi:tetratricopeptide (TPR) repeat protein/TolB-like protein